MWLGFHVWLGLACIATWLTMTALFRISSLSALTTAMLAPIYTGMILGWNAFAWVALVMSALLIYRHKSNIQKLMAGTEHRLGQSE